MSSVAPSKTSEGGGLRAPPRTWGPRSARRHRRGAARIAGDGLQRAHHRQPQRPGGRARRSSRRPRRGSTSCPSRDAEKAAVEGGLTETRRGAVAADYGDAQLDALRLALGAVALARCCRCGSRGDCRPGRSPPRPRARPEPRRDAGPHPRGRHACGLAARRGGRGSSPLWRPQQPRRSPTTGSSRSLSLIEDADSVELKVTIAEPRQRSRSNPWAWIRSAHGCAWCRSSTRPT